jgi:GxxExxY protein
MDGFNADELHGTHAERRGHGVGREKRDESKLLHHDVTRAIIGAFYHVGDTLGPGFLESVYANATAVVLRHAGLGVQREASYRVIFMGVEVGLFRADLVVEDKVIVETKVARAIDPAHRAQLLNCLRASQKNVGLILNYGGNPGFSRIISSKR